MSRAAAEEISVDAAVAEGIYTLKEEHENGTEGKTFVRRCGTKRRAALCAANVPPVWKRWA